MITINGKLRIAASHETRELGYTIARALNNGRLSELNPTLRMRLLEIGMEILEMADLQEDAEAIRDRRGVRRIA